MSVSDWVVLQTHLNLTKNTQTSSLFLARNGTNPDLNLEKLNYQPFQTQIHLPKSNYEPTQTLKKSQTLNPQPGFDPTLDRIGTAARLISTQFSPSFFVLFAKMPPF